MLLVEIQCLEIENIFSLVIFCLLQIMNCQLQYNAVQNNAIMLNYCNFLLNATSDAILRSTINFTTSRFKTVQDQNREFENLLSTYRCKLKDSSFHQI